MNQLMPGDRLTADILRLLAYLTSPLVKVSVLLQRQAELATVVRYSATMLDVRVPPDLPVVDLPDGPVPGNALVYDQEQLVGELIVWIREGRLIGLEQAWYAGDPPQSWPHPEMVRIT